MCSVVLLSCTIQTVVLLQSFVQPTNTSLHEHTYRVHPFGLLVIFLHQPSASHAACHRINLPFCVAVQQRATVAAAAEAAAHKGIIAEVSHHPKKKQEQEGLAAQKDRKRYISEPHVCQSQEQGWKTKTRRERGRGINTASPRHRVTASQRHTCLSHLTKECVLCTQQETPVTLARSGKGETPKWMDPKKGLSGWLAEGGGDFGVYICSLVWSWWNVYVKWGRRYARTCSACRLKGHVCS